MIAAIDLNCDLGEGAGNDEALMPLITSANIACAGHAGDEGTMRTTVRLALRHGVAVGAHPGFADREQFGRRELRLTPGEIVALVREQVESLRTVAKSEGARVTHVKPHGALYNLAARDASVAAAIAEAVADIDDRLWLYGLAGGELLIAGRARGLRVVAEVFADRTYQADGSLTPRNRPDALVTRTDVSIHQVLRMVRESRVRATDGTDVAIVADTVCLHGDGEHAVEFACALRDALLGKGIDVRSACVG
ncbi:LamB/YcsF family protein [Rariglobus hedericola]|uniref:5-oxoprolinase subunit A n=1 Tax=Rariglobus hedericola TaxID=2597822 RepID=A0A556QST6_9BACT|nr:LamB/YcsF family protein [Rariglobus hedericola]